MMSSTFKDLEQHRAALMKAIEAQGMHAVAMEQDAALPVTVIDSSLRKVRAAAAYIGLVSHSYGTVPDSAERNPEGLSLTELEFREARRLGRPMLIFIMGDGHYVRPADVERDPDKIRKLEKFRDEVKRSGEDAGVERVYREFDSVREFETDVMQSVAELRRHLDESFPGAVSAEPLPAGDEIPRPPALYAEPPYIGSHPFTGRVAELETLSDWAAPAEARPVLLYEAIGGTGKSMLTWEWLVNQATGARSGWAGRFWYSFYERGADMADFSRRALAYMTGRPLSAFRGKKQIELSTLLLRQLQARPWLLVLDGLERVLVAYHRYDAAQVADEDAGGPDLIARRDPSSAIRPQDDDLLRSLAAAGPSKVLVTSRLIPRVLLNQAGRPIPGVLHRRLGGLRPADAEVLLRECGVRGDSELIRSYLGRHCDCHPLVTGIVAGLVTDYLPDRGNFDAWAADPAHGGQLNLAALDLVQKRNHILKAAIGALPDKAKELLSTLALLSEAVDYDTLAAVNPYLPPAGPDPDSDPDPDPDPEPGWARSRPRDGWLVLRPAIGWPGPRSSAAAYRKQLARDQAPGLSGPEPGESEDAARQLAAVVRDLERRGLLQYDPHAGRYDLHPVVRGFASGGLRAEDRDRLGRRAVDYFSQRPADPYEKAETLEDVRNGLRLVRARLQMGQKEEAFDTYYGGLANSLLFNLEANDEVLSLLRPFFGKDWTASSGILTPVKRAYLYETIAVAFHKIGQLALAQAACQSTLEIGLREKEWQFVWASLTVATRVLRDQHGLALCDRLLLLALTAAEVEGGEQLLFVARLNRFRHASLLGRWPEARTEWRALDPMGRNWNRHTYRPGDAEAAYAVFQFRQGLLSEDVLAEAEALARSGRNRQGARSLHALRARWLVERGELDLAAENLHEAIRLTHESGGRDGSLEASLAVVRFRLGQLPDPRREADRLSGQPGPPDLALAELWDAAGDAERAGRHALDAYRWAWADGAPYVDRYELDRAAALLRRLGVPVPVLPGYDPDRDPQWPFERKLRAAFRRELARQAKARRKSGDRNEPPG
jgi:Domain of unknown function (DUF4062)